MIVISSGYIINSDSNWFKRFKEEAKNNGWVVHFQISGKQPAKIVDRGTFLFHRIKGTNKVLGYSKISEIGYDTFDNAIKKFGIAKLGYNSKKEIFKAASKWSTSVSHIIFYEVLENLGLCDLDLNKDLIDKYNIHYGRPPSHLPTVGKSLTNMQFNALMNHIKKP